jgi:hypothetical protein
MLSAGRGALSGWRGFVFRQGSDRTTEAGQLLTRLQVVNMGLDWSLVVAGGWLGQGFPVGQGKI